MDIDYLHHLMLASKNFLAKLYESTPRQNCRVISLANENELNILIKILHLVCNGHIKVRKQDFTIIRKSKRLGLLKSKFEKKASLGCALNLSVKEKQHLLKKFCAIYPSILYFLFFLD